MKQYLKLINQMMLYNITKKDTLDLLYSKLNPYLIKTVI